jgi:phage FluMu protein Com
MVSGEAKSAGTIMVLSGDEILMTETGSLGPIDAQVRIGRSIISAYDYLEWTNQKREEAQKIGKLNPFDATLVAQISPGELSGVFHALKYAEDLVTDWLAKYKFRTWTITETRRLTNDMKTRRAQEIATELTNHAKWRTHGRSIKATDLNDIGLKVTRVESDPKLSDIVYRIQTVCRLLFSSTNTYKIFATEKEKVFKSATPVSTVTKIPVQAADVAEFEARCPKCGKVHKLYAKFKDDPKIDADFKKKGNIAFPKDNRLKCECGFEIDLGGIRNEIETKVGKKLII